MIIKILMDNVTRDAAFEVGHGLSFGIETTHGNYLFDFGPDERFIKNAERMQFPLKTVKTGILSHGHDDHAGGLAAFLRFNPLARVVAHPAAFEDHYSGQSNGDFKYIGIDSSLKEHPNLVFTDQDQCPSHHCTIITHVDRSAWNPSGNLSLFTYKNGCMQPDDFRHEVHLVLDDDDQWVLFSGCGHSGIINILEAVKARMGRYPDVVFGGLHLHSQSGNSDEHEVYLKHLAKYMLQIPTRFYTGHCTGEVPFAFLRAIVGEKLQYASAGCVIDTKENSRCM